MKKALSFVVCIATIFLFCAPYVYADNVEHLMSIDNALKKNNHLLNSNIKLSFSPKIQENLILDRGFYVSNRKTNGVFKTFESSCTRAFLSAIISLQDRAVIEGGNAVINIHSFYKKKEMFSEEVFECHEGNIMSGVALKGRVVRIDS